MWRPDHAQVLADNASTTTDHAHSALGTLARKDDFAHHYDYGDTVRANAANVGPPAVCGQ